MTYEEYLRSDAWRRLCWRKLLRHGELSEYDRRIVAYRLLAGRGFPQYYAGLVDLWNAQTAGGQLILTACGDCKQKFQRRYLNIHHLNYDRLFREALDDLAILCRPCHAKWHKEAPPPWYHCVEMGMLTMEQLENVGREPTPIALGVMEAIDKKITKQGAKA